MRSYDFEKKRGTAINNGLFFGLENTLRADVCHRYFVYYPRGKYKNL